MADFGNSADSESSNVGNEYGESHEVPEVASMTERSGDDPVSSNIVNDANDDFGRGPPESSMTERPGDAYVGTNIVSNANDDFSRDPTVPSMTERPGVAPVNTNIISNANGDLAREPHVPSMTERPGVAPVNTNIISNANGDLSRDRPGANSFTHHQTAQHTPPYRPVHISQHNPVQDRPFTVDVKNYSNSKTYKFQVKNSTLVDELMKDIEKKIPGAIPPSQQRLIYAGKNLEAGKTISDYKVEPNQTILLTGGNRGG